MKKYFADIKNKKALVKAYRQLAKKLHPDAGGDAEEFKAMTAEFNTLLTILPDDEAKQTSAEPKNQRTEIPPEMMAALNKVIHLDGIEIEICGSWIWISGNTYPVKNTIKAAGFRFSNNKKMWYWHNGEYHKKSRKSLAIEEIRELHGSITVPKATQASIA